MRVHYLEHNGRHYEYGTIVNFKNGRKAIFFVCDPESNYYMFAFKDNKCRDGYCYYSYTKRDLEAELIKITDEIDMEYVKCNPIQFNKISGKPTFSEELKIDGLLFAWVWYIFLMGITTFFIGRIFYWVIISFVFFDYRNKKFKKEGYK